MEQQQQHQNQPQQPAHPQPPKKKGHNRLLIFFGLVVALILVASVGFGITYFFNKKGPIQTDDSQVPDTRPVDYEQKEEEPQQGSAVFL